MRRLESDTGRENVLLVLRIAIFTVLVPATVVVYVPASLASSAGSAVEVATGAPVVVAGHLFQKGAQAARSPDKDLGAASHLEKCASAQTIAILERRRPESIHPPAGRS